MRGTQRSMSHNNLRAPTLTRNASYHKENNVQNMCNEGYTAALFSNVVVVFSNVCKFYKLKRDCCHSCQILIGFSRTKLPVVNLFCNGSVSILVFYQDPGNSRLIEALNPLPHTKPYMLCKVYVFLFNILK